jgi:translocator protein
MNQWYKTLKKAPWSPPNVTFGIVWPILYTLMAISVGIIWSSENCYPYCSPITFFIIQLAFNLVWTTIFFKWQMPKLALLDMIFIMGVTFYTYKQFLPISKTAAYLLIPYMLWLCVAFSLNLYIILNN